MAADLIYLHQFFLIVICIHNFDGPRVKNILTKLKKPIFLKINITFSRTNNKTVCSKCSEATIN